MTLPSRVDFEQPPVNEVVCGALFKRIEGFGTIHFGLLWTQFAEEFPRATDMPPLLRPVGDPPVLDTTERRVWFVSEDGRHLVQVQRDRLHFNWRRLEDTDVYPRFEAVYAAFNRHFDTFEAFVAHFGALEIEHLELTYINLIPMESANYGKVCTVLPDLPWKQHGVVPEPESFQWVLEGPAPHGPGARLRIAAQSVVRVNDRSPMLRLELTVRGRPAEGHREAWFGHAHESIVQSFVDLTSEDAHQTWRRRT